MGKGKNIILPQGAYSLKADTDSMYCMDVYG